MGAVLWNWHWPSPWQWNPAESLWTQFYDLFMKFLNLKTQFFQSLKNTNVSHLKPAEYFATLLNSFSTCFLYCSLIQFFGSQKKNFLLHKDFCTPIDDKSVIMPTAIPSQIVVGLNVDIQRSDGKLSLSSLCILSVSVFPWRLVVRCCVGGLSSLTQWLCSHPPLLIDLMKVCTAAVFPLQ